MSRASSSNSTLSAAAAPSAGSGSAAGGACRSAAAASPAPIPVPTPGIPVRAALLLGPSCSALCAAPNGAAAGGRRMAGAPTGLVGVLLRCERAAATPSASFSPPAPCKSCVAALASLAERPRNGGGRVAEGDPLVLDGAEASLGRTVSRQPSFQRSDRSPRPPAPGRSLVGRVVVAREAAWLSARVYSSSRARISACSLSLFSLATCSRATSGHLQAIFRPSCSLLD